MKIRVFEAFAGYGSQAMALQRLKEDYPDFDYEVVGISEIDKFVVQAYEAVHGHCPNYGDISKIDWNNVPDFDLFTYSFPCFVPGTLVLTDNGYIPIEDVTHNHRVITHNNRFCKVSKLMSKDYVGLIYTIRAMNTEGIQCTPDHPFYARRMRRVWDNNIRQYRRVFDAPEWKHASKLDKYDYIGYAINQESRLPQWSGVIDNRWGHGNISNKISEMMHSGQFWYLMGRYVGDGWKKTSKTGSGIVICCSDRNYHSLINCIESLGLNCNIGKERTVTKVIISSNELHSFVDRYGYYAHGKKIDFETISLPVELLGFFMDGLLDSDGHINKDGMHKINSVSRELIYGIAQCATKVYRRPVSVYETKRSATTIIEGRCVNQRDTYTVVFKRKTGKQDKAFYEDGYLWHPIRDIKTTECVTPIFNLSVEEDESYTANGCIVHNCTDISNAGQQKGFDEDSGTRSSLLWECRKAIQIKRPQFLLMENVKALTSKKFMPLFNKWLAELESYGYQNFWKVLNTKDFGIPQNRERTFCVSILADYAHYEFPKPFPLELRIKDILEENVDEKFYLSDKMLQYFLRVNEDQSHCHNFNPLGGEDTAFTIRTRAGQRVDDNFVKDVQENP